MLLSVGPEARGAFDRAMLWRVVQACTVNAKLTGATFPCLAVDPTGFVVLRPPLEATHVVVAPTRRIAGVEDGSLQGGDGPNLFAAAWAARRYVLAGAPRPLAREDVALAINSQPGRTQDQLHIHVDCVNAAARAAVTRQAGAIVPGTWTPLHRPVAGGRYLATLVPGDTLAGLNLFQLAAAGLRLRPENLHEMTIGVMPTAGVDGRPGFFVLAGRTITSRSDAAQGENLLDHTCRA